MDSSHAQTAIELGIGILMTIIGWYLNALRSSLNRFTEQLGKQADALTDLALTVGKDYVTRAEHKELRDEFRGDITRVNERLDAK